MTEFVKREFAALDEFQQRMDEYGLTVNRRSMGGCYLDHDCTLFSLGMTTEAHPVKGNKALIKRLEQDGYYPDVRWSLNAQGKRCKEFLIHGSAIIAAK